MRILVIRFSAMGDVALTVPAIRRIIQENPALEIVFLSNPFFAPFFKDIDRFQFRPVNLKIYAGIRGIWKLYQELKSDKPFDQILDLHGSLRSRILSIFFKLDNLPIYRIDKGKAEKKKAIRTHHKILKPLFTSTNRYLNVFKDAGFKMGKGYFPFEDPNLSSKSSNWEGIQGYVGFTNINSNKKIGWAPFAGFELKEMPWIKQVKLVQDILALKKDLEIILFSSPGQKSNLLPFYEGLNSEDSDRIHNSFDLCQGLEEELKLMQSLDLMVSMDSGNLHMAALLGVKVLGIYGTTHPFLGFSPFLQGFTGVFQREDLSCRPCTVFGNGKCYRGDFACMNQIPDDLLIRKIIERV